MVTDEAESQSYHSDFWQNNYWTLRLSPWVLIIMVGSGPGCEKSICAMQKERVFNTTEPLLSALAPVRPLTNHLQMFSLYPHHMPTRCMLDSWFLKDFCLIHCVPNFLSPHNHILHFHLAFRTSFALLGGQFHSTVMACKQIRCISTFLLSVHTTQIREILCFQVFPNLLPMAAWKPFQAGFQLWNVMPYSGSHKGLFLFKNEKEVWFSSIILGNVCYYLFRIFSGLFCLSNLFVRICFKI